MTGRVAEGSPRLKARIAGAIYLIVIIVGIFAEAFVRERLTVHGDAAATAHNILTHELLFRMGFAANTILLPCNIAVAVIFFDLFRIVNRSVALLMTFFILAAATIEGINLLNHMAPLIMLTDRTYSNAFNAEQLQAQAYLPLQLQPVGYNISLIIFGFYCLALGYLIFRSTFLPRTLGVLLPIGGLCYITNGYANFISPGFAAHLFPYILIPCFVAEASLTAWLLTAGVNGPRWQAQAGTVDTAHRPATIENIANHAGTRI